MAIHLPDEMIGGALVRRRFKHGGKDLMSGHKLSADEVLTIRLANRKALINSGFIDVFPKGAANPENVQRIILHRSDDRYDVIQGFKVNEAPLDHDAALKLRDNLHNAKRLPGRPKKEEPPVA